MGKDVKISAEEALKFYSRKEIAEAICNFSKDREIGVLYSGGHFGKRPEVLMFPQDVIEMAKHGVITFNISEERWDNPLHLEPGMRGLELDNNRIGWDLILDIDCKQIEFSKVTALVLMDALKFYDVPFTIKFSGGSGFHIGVAWESIPKMINQKNTSILFPDIPRAVAEYIIATVEDSLRKKFLEKYDIDYIMKRTKLNFEDLVKENKLDPWKITGVDTVLISNRHLIRSVYSFNEKSGLVSIPLLPEDIESFELKDAVPDKVNIEEDSLKGRIFLKPQESTEGIKRLFIQALDYAHKKHLQIEEKETKEYQPLLDAAPEETFPPCIKHILRGIKDGKKRSTFVLVNFLRSAGWSYDMIEERLKEWNKVLEEPLHEQDLFASFRYSKGKNKRVLPPNCTNPGYYLDFGVCNPDNLCKKIKNPISYVKVKVKLLEELKKEEDIKKIREEKRKKKIEKGVAKETKKETEKHKEEAAEKPS